VNLRADTVSRRKEVLCAPPPVLHIVENLNRGAVENWLVRMLAHAKSRGVDLNWSFYCTSRGNGMMEEEARRLGARILFSPVPMNQKIKFTRALRAELRNGRFKVLHCHHDLVSAVYLIASVGLPIRRRIVHAHNADEAVLTPSALKQSLYREPMRRVCLMMADRIVGISNHTLDTLLARRPRQPVRDLVHYYGVEPAPFADAKGDRVAFRQDLGLPPDALILLFAGRIVTEKNPVFVVDVLSELRRLEPRAVAVFAGSGSLVEVVRERARDRGVEPWIRLIGWRSDLAEVMCASDLFILPRPEQPMEGFGLAVVEAQLAGLRMLLSLGIPDDPLLPDPCLRRLPLSDGASAWAEAAQELLAAPAPFRADTVKALGQSPMDMDRALEELMVLHA
jgi:glycosyltransferase involved in cell wall biosynthesis